MSIQIVNELQQNIGINENCVFEIVLFDYDLTTEMLKPFYDILVLWEDKKKIEKEQGKLYNKIQK